MSSCKKMVEVPKPANEILTLNAFTDSASATGVVTGIYASMIANEAFEWGGLTMNTSKSADDLVGTQLTSFETNTLSSSDDAMLKFWGSPYATLLTINTAIEGLTVTSTLSTRAKNQLLGECYFDRAFINFYLVNLWGDAAALVITSDFVKNTSMPSTPSAATYAQIVSDLQQAQLMLYEEYPSPNRARPNLMAANALLARVYLYLNQYDNAITQANKVIASSTYKMPAPASAFLQGSTETIWSIQPNVSFIPGVTADGNLYVPFSAYSAPPFTLNNNLIAAFEAGDQRKVQWTRTTTVSGESYTVPYKYKKNYFAASAAENYVVLRLAEQYLIRAEAYIKTGNIASGVTDLNVVRQRAGLPALAGNLSLNEAVAAVERERRSELFVEWGHRWLDLKRWPATDGSNTTRADQVLSALKPAWQPFQKLYPIPLVQFRYDRNLIQNPGY